ncbi:hypothetical protein KBD69_04225 [Candidatus Woesebacteria bacterium]|nr:hypothetical protein [Candidatus Woesebacteria bacterium]
MKKTESPCAPLPDAKRQVLVLTNNRSSQQTDSQKEWIRQIKTKLYGRKFKTRLIPPRFCESRKIAFMVYEGKRLAQINVKRIGCNSWTCPRCQIKKALRLKYLLLNIALLNDIWYHLVLTLDPKTIPLEYFGNGVNKTHEYITKKFNHLVVTLKRNKFTYYSTKKKRFYKFELKKQVNILKYIWVLQFQPGTGIAHLHILLNQFLPAEIIRKVWMHIGGGIDIHIEKVKSVNRISRYVLNYIVDGIDTHKGNPIGGFKYFERRYSVSRSCTRPDRVGKRIFSDLSPDKLKLLLQKKNLGFLFDEVDNPDSDDIEITLTAGLPPKIHRIAHDD